MIKAPFNFVPMSHDVFFPDWAATISQDIPFKNSFSGTIKVTIKAETPIFVRNGQNSDAGDNSFSHINTSIGRQYFIPGTTIKGCIRNVLEIMSFGKLEPITDSHTEKQFKYSPRQLEKERQAISAEEQNLSKASFDLAECIFGSVAQESSLRGRVQFSNFICDKVVQMPENNKSFTMVLNSPHPELLPLYVQQDGSKYQDYDNEEAYPDDILKGWKRYILRSGFWTKKPGKKDDVLTTFMPLNKGSIFSGKIHYHNLKREELGALLCALTWYGEEGHYHQIGLAKPFGFGRVSVVIDQESIKESKAFITDFVNMMMGWLEKQTGSAGWRKHWMIKELFLLSGTIRRWDDKNFYYMGGQECKKAKASKEYLQLFSKIIKDIE